jgi:hypothetical protein
MRQSTIDSHPLASLYAAHESHADRTAAATPANESPPHGSQVRSAKRPRDDQDHHLGKLQAVGLRILGEQSMLVSGVAWRGVAWRPVGLRSGPGVSNSGTGVLSRGSRVPGCTRTYVRSVLVLAYMYVYV